jgi:flagellar assembly factor FliW
MKAAAIMENKSETEIYSDDSLLRFQEGLIGFSDCKTFVLLESEEIAPFRRLQSVERKDVGFLVLDPTYVVKDFLSLIPQRDWETIELVDPAARLAFVICIIGPTPAQSTGNLQAPIIINYANMTGRQLILADAELSSRQPLV